jgi:uncharacterized caspase-like protein
MIGWPIADWSFLMRGIGTLVLGICAACLFGQPASAERRVALVMGNSVYQNVGRLANPVRDSDAMSETFRSAGFDVVELRHDLKVNEMRRALRDFSNSVREADVAIIYFAGHGIEIGGTNYVIPVDAVLERDIDVFDEAIPLDRLLTVIDPATQLRLIILDACRDNPFDRTMKRTTLSRAVGRGLAKVEPSSPNTLIAFAAKAGSTASDGGGKNSPFTAALVKYLPRPGLDLRKALGFARDEVLKATNNRQEPFIYGSLGGNDVPLVPAPASPPVAASPPDPGAESRRDYELAERVGTKPVWDSFITKYPSGFYTELAKAQRDKLAAEAATVAATEKARIALEEQKRLAIEGAKATEQARAAAEARAAEEARISAEKRKAIEENRVAAEKIKAGDKNAQNERPVGQVATVAPAQQSGTTSPQPDQAAAAEIPRLLQTELRRVGCSTGSVDNNWTASAQRSLSLFNKNAKTNFDVKIASLDALDAVRGRASRVCPLICDHGYRAEGEACIKITCKAGFELGDDNNCERIVKKRTVARERRHERRPRSSGGKCFSYAGTSYCE